MPIFKIQSISDFKEVEEAAENVNTLLEQNLWGSR
jgi:hypothetical protein